MNRQKLIAGIVNIPKNLREINTWCGFNTDEDGNLIKKPLSLVDYKGLGVNDTDRLASFEEAVEALKSGKVEALGIGLTKDCGITCIDIDCHEDSKIEKFNEINKEILEQFNSYAETSISGRGTHIYIKAKKPSGYKHIDKHGIIEVYDTSRFMVITGDKISKQAEIIDYQVELDKLCEKHLIKQIASDDTIISQCQYNIEDDKVLEKLAEFEKGKLLLEGKWKEVEKWDKASGEGIQAYPSQSEADFAFMMLLLYVNGNNPLQAEKIFKKSAMWDKKRQAKKSSGYVRHQITEASLRCTKVYDWKKIDKTVTEEIIDFEEVLEQYQENKIIKLAQDNKFEISRNIELNEYVRKFVCNFGTGYKTLLDTSLGDYDNATNGIRFNLINSENLIYQSKNKEWLKWNEKYWDRCYDEDLLQYSVNVFNHLKHEAYNIAMQSINESDEFTKTQLEEKARWLFQYASTSKNKRTCMEMIEFSKSCFIKNQEDMNIRIDENKNVINLNNGVFDFESMQLLPHKKEFYQTKITKIDYDKDAKCDLWQSTLNKILPNKAIRNYLQKAVGYTICSDYMEKAMFILYGEDGNNGKTTIINIIMKLLGDFGVAVYPQTIMENYSNKNNGPRPDLLQLRDRRFVSVSETETSDKLSEGLIKTLTGGGYISCRGLHKDPVQFTAIFKIWLDTNYKPQVKGTDLAIWNRLKIIPFDVRIPNSEIDRKLGDKLEKELPGILNWAIDGYKMYKEEGLDMPKEMDELIKEYAEDMSSLDQWFKECIKVLEPHEIKRKHKCYTSKELYQSYQQWCEFNNEYCWTQRKFTQEINKKEACKEVKKVQGYVQYLAVQLNDLGKLCADRGADLPLVFASKYNKLVNSKFEENDILNLFGKDLEERELIQKQSEEVEEDEKIEQNIIVVPINQPNYYLTDKY